MNFDIVAGFRYVVIDHWYWWLAYTVAVYFGWYFLVGRRVYKMIDGKPYVKHGLLGKWIDLEAHLRDKHREDI